MDTIEKEQKLTLTRSFKLKECNYQLN